MIPVFLLLLFVVMVIRNCHIFPFIFLVYAFLFTPIMVGPISLLRLISVFVFIYVLLITKKTQSNYLDSVILVFFFYYILCHLLIVLYGDGVPKSLQYSALRGVLYDIMLYYSLWKVDVNVLDYKKWQKYLYVFLLLACSYGVYTYVTQENPYISFINNYTPADLESRAVRSINDARGILSGRITGTSAYTIQYGILVVLFIWYYIAVYYKQIHSLYFWVLFLFLCINLYLTGSRGPIAALIISGAIYCIRILSWQKRIITIVLVWGLVHFFASWGVFEIANDEVAHGSSSEGRFLQLQITLSFINDLNSFLFGHGLEFSSYLVSSGKIYYGEFESSILAGLVNYGIIGLLLIYCGQILFWGYIAYSLFKHKLITSSNLYFLLSFLICYTIYTIVVGNAYGYLAISIYIMLIKYFCIQSKSVRCKKLII